MCPMIFWVYLIYVVAVLGSETMIFHAVALALSLGILVSMQLQLSRNLGHFKGI